MTDSPSRRNFVYFSRPSNSSQTLYSGHAKSRRAYSRPSSSCTTHCGSGAGKPCRQHTTNVRVSPTDSILGSAKRSTSSVLSVNGWCAMLA